MVVYAPACYRNTTLLKFWFLIHPRTVVSYVEGHTTQGTLVPISVSDFFIIKNEHETLFPNPGVE